MGTAYGVKYFRNYTSKEKKKGLQYETEYLISGKESEKENLGSVFSKILLMRFLPNLIYVQGDTVKQGQAEALAASILGITGIVPLSSWQSICCLQRWPMENQFLTLSLIHIYRLP